MLNPSLTRCLTAAILIAALAAALWGVQIATAGAAGDPPSSPGNVLAHLIVPQEGDPRIRVSWDPPAEGQPTGYAITRSDGAAHDAAATAATHSDYNITPGTSYTYTVSAKNGASAGPASGTATVAVPAAPSAPGELAAKAPAPALQDTSGTVSLTWQPATAPRADQCAGHFPVTGYTVHRTHGDDEELLAALGPDDGEYTDADAGFGTGYSYRVTATSRHRQRPGLHREHHHPGETRGDPRRTHRLNQPGRVRRDGEPQLEGPGRRASAHRVPDKPGRRQPGRGNPGGQPRHHLVQRRHRPSRGLLLLYGAGPHGQTTPVPNPNTAVIEPPAPATSVTASVESGAVNLAWNAPAKGKAGTYRVQRMATADGEWTQVAETADTGHTDDTAPANGAYTYRVQHRNPHGGSEWANSNSVTLLGVPPKVTGVTATVSGRRHSRVTWDAPSTGTVDSYQVSYGPEESEDRDSASVTAPGPRPSPTGTTPRAQPTSTPSRPRTRPATGRGPNRPPPRRLNTRRRPRRESRPPSAATTLSCPGPPRQPASWTPTRSGPEPAAPKTRPPRRRPETSFTHEEPGGRHPLQPTRSGRRTKQAKAHGRKAVTATRLLPPNPPTGVKTSKGGSNIVVTWTAPGTGAVGGYQLEYRQTMTEAWNRKSVEAADTSWTHEGPTPGTTYEYRLRTVNAAGVSEWTHTGGGNLVPGRSPTHVHPDLVSMGTNRIAGAVEPVDITSGTTGYEFRQNVDGGEWTVSSVGNRNVILVDCNEGESYREYAVRAVIGAQKGDWMATRTLSLTRPSEVRNLTAYLDGRNSIRVKWDHPDTGEPA